MESSGAADMSIADVISRLRDWWSSEYQTGKEFYSSRAMPTVNPATLDGTLVWSGVSGRTTPFVDVGALKAENSQLKFLLSQALMIDAPTDRFNASLATTRFAYIHPKTLAKASGGDCIIKHTTPYVLLSPSPTRWVSTSLMPEGRVIYTPNPLPGLLKLLAR